MIKLDIVSKDRSQSGRLFRATTDVLGVVEIKATEDLSHLDSLILVHPWIDLASLSRPSKTVPTVPLQAF